MSTVSPGDPARAVGPQPSRLDRTAAHRVDRRADRRVEGGPRPASAPATGRWLGLAGGLVAVAGLGWLATAGPVGGGDGTDADALGPGRDSITIDIEHSRFSEDRIVVRRGTTVRIVVDNGDPIGHELIVGPPEVHERHESGTEAAHPPVPGEVTAPALRRVETTYTFDQVGPMTFACHLPGHVAYGMIGEFEVVE